MRFGRSTKWVVNVGFGAVMVALVGIGLLSYLSIRELTATAERVAHTQTVLAGLEEVNTMVTDALRGERGFVITGNPLYLRPYMDARERLPAKVREVTQLTSDNPRQQARLRTFQRQVAESMALLERVVVVRRTSGFEAAQALIQSGAINDAVEAASASVREMEDEERALLSARTARADAGTRRVTAMVLLSSIATLLFLAGAGYVLNRDIDAQQAAAAALRRSREEFQALVEASGSFIVATDPDLRVTVFNREAERLSGLRREHVVGRPLADAFGAQTGFGAFEGLLRRAMAGQEVRDFDAPLQGPGGDAHVLLWNVNRLGDADGGAAGIIAVGTEITARKQMEGELQHQALHDPLTGLLNRRAFTERLEAHTATAGARGGAVLFVDLDRFKQVNDTLGHAAGDVLLQEVAHRLAASVRAADVLARLGGDEFAVLLRSATDADAGVVATRILDALRRPFQIQGREVRVSGSVGIAAIGAPGGSTSDGAAGSPGDLAALLHQADVALYQAKALGRDRFALASSTPRPEVQRRQVLERDLGHAAARGQLRLDYQPLVALADGRLAGFEALVRWQHPDLGLVLPGDFIPLAEETGQIVDVGSWVLETSCQQLAAWERQSRGRVLLMVSVNFSRAQFLHPGAAAHLARTLKTCGFTPSNLIIEITERVLERDGPAIIAGLPLFRELGVQLALDDFGTGFSSLSALGTLPLQTLKLDRSFVDGLAASGPQFEVVRAIVELAHRLGMTVVAEGIETTEQLVLLRRLGCDFGQGYHLSRPLAPDAASALLRGGVPWAHHWGTAWRA